MPAPPLALVGGLTLLPDHDNPTPATVVCGQGRILDVLEPDAPVGEALVLNLDGQLLAPGLIDLHGDAFERSVMPRPGVTLDMPIALDDNDRQLLAAGITTSYLSATDSWEPGLRSRATLQALVSALRQRRSAGTRHARPEVKLHVRHERCNTDGHTELLQLLKQGDIEFLSFNDHTHDERSAPSKTQLQRTGLQDQELIELEARHAAQRGRGAEQEQELASVAREVGCPTASHDPSSLDDLTRDLTLSVTLAEFPTSIQLAGRYAAAGLPVLLGSPNLVRGGSHLGNLSVAEAMAAGACDILCSDYHYPSLLQAPFVAQRLGLMPLGRAWEQVAASPARAAGLTDRGRIEPGLRADLIVIADGSAAGHGADGPAAVTAALVAGLPTGLRPLTTATALT